MRSTRWLFSAVWLIVLFHLPPAFAMQKDAFPKPSDYSVRMPSRDHRPSYYEIPEAVGVRSALFNIFTRISDWQRPPDQRSEPTSILFHFRRVDDTIKIDFSPVFQGEKIPWAIENEIPEGSAGSYSLRVGEWAILKELASFGIEPFKIEVVPSNSRTLDTSRVGNLTKSIEVVRIDEARNHHRVTYKNISPKKVLALRIFYPMYDIHHGGFPQIQTKPIMLPGETYYGDFYEFPDSRHLTQEDVGPGKFMSSKVTVLGVVFDDFTYEGEKVDAIEVAARVRARQIQLPRLVAMLKDAVAAYGDDKQRAVNKLKKDAEALKTEPEASVIADLVKRFSPLTEKEKGKLIYYLKLEMDTERDNLLAIIENGERLERTNGGLLENCTKCENWLTVASNGYERGLRSLLSLNLLP
ncbi:MAG TPA: hypothetical protein VF131_20535 [Blastocatellia bacterium]|nr:hypothetical protein [Blastocatellia bacterium]